MEENRYGRRIRAFRKLKRIQQTELAKQIGLSATILGRIERGEKQPSEEQLQLIANVFNIDIHELKGNEQ